MAVGRKGREGWWSEVDDGTYKCADKCADADTDGSVKTDRNADGSAGTNTDIYSDA